jgi:hypothetical protein
LFTALTGVAVGLAVSSRNARTGLLLPVAGYVGAVLAHSLWNSATLSGGFLVAYAALMLPAFLAFVAFALYRRRSERGMMQVALEDAAQRGLVPMTDIPWLVDLRARRHARAFARQRGGAPGERAMRDYQAAAIELAYLHHRYLRGTAPRDFAERGHEHVQQLNAVRPNVAFPGQVVPTR